MLFFLIGDGYISLQEKFLCEPLKKFLYTMLQDKLPSCLVRDFHEYVIPGKSYFKGFREELILNTQLPRAAKKFSVLPFIIRRSYFSGGKSLMKTEKISSSLSALKSSYGFFSH